MLRNYNSDVAKASNRSVLTISSTFFYSIREVLDMDRDCLVRSVRECHESLPPTSDVAGCVRFGLKRVAELPDWDIWELESEQSQFLFFLRTDDEWILIHSGNRTVALNWIRQKFAKYENILVLWKFEDPDNPVCPAGYWKPLKPIDPASGAAPSSSLFDDYHSQLDEAQSNLVDRAFDGPALVKGPAGTGKTALALGRACHMTTVIPSDEDVLVTTYSTNMASFMKARLPDVSRFYYGSHERIKIRKIDKVIFDLVERWSPDDDELRRILSDLAAANDLADRTGLVIKEWKHTISAHGILTKEEYLEVQRVGSGQGGALRKEQRERLWPVFKQTFDALNLDRKMDFNLKALEAIRALEHRSTLPLNKYPNKIGAVVVDEVQDMTVPKLKLIKSLCGPGNLENLWLTGDSAQRIYPGGYSLFALGIDVRGRSFNLKVNYRNSQEIYDFFRKFTADTNDNLDGEAEEFPDVTCRFSGSEPASLVFLSRTEEATWVADTVAEWINDEADDIQASEIAIIAPKWNLFGPVEQLLSERGINSVRMRQEYNHPNSDYSPLPGQADSTNSVHLHSIHGSKGVEYRAVLFIFKDMIVKEDLMLALMHVASSRPRERLVLTRSLLETGRQDVFSLVIDELPF